MARNEYFVCPLCGINKVIKSVKRGQKAGHSEELQWPIIDIMNSFSVQVREGGGKKAGESGNKGRGKAPGSGFHLVPSESLTLAEVLKDPVYADIVQGMKEQLLRVVKSGVETGLISKEELI